MSAPIKAPPERVRALAADGLSQATIAAELGVSRERIRQICNQHGIATISGARDLDGRAEVIDLHAEGLTAPEIAAETGRSGVLVRAWLREVGIEPHRPHTMADDIQVCIEAGMTMSECARHLGKRVQVIYNAAKSRGLKFRFKHSGFGGSGPKVPV